MFNKLLPGWDDRTVRYYYLSEAAINLWFIAPVWFFVFRHFVTVPEIGINEIIAFSLGFLAEVPSGALADTIGRRKSLILAGILLIIGSIFTAFSFNLLTLIISQSLWFIGYAFYSGANDALVYDKLILDKKEHDWVKISARKRSLTILVMIVSVLIGGYLYTIQFRLPFIAHIFAMLAFLLCVIQYPKDKTLKIINTSTHSFSEYRKNIAIGIKELLRPKLRFLLWGVLCFATIYYTYEWGVLRPIILSIHGYEGYTASILSFIMNSLLFLLFLVLPKIFGKHIGEKKVLITVILATVTYMLFSYNAALWIVGVIVIVYTLLASTIDWWTGLYINKHVSSTYRATALSTWAMLQKVPYIVLVGMITNLSNQAFSIFILASGSIVGIFALGTLLLLPRIDPTLDKNYKNRKVQG